MPDHEKRIFYEPRAEADLVPDEVANGPSARFRSRHVVAAAAVLAVVFGGWWLFIRPSGPVASSVTVVAVTGDSNSAVVDLWAHWWRAYADVRESMSIDGGVTSFSPRPLEELAAGSEVVMQAGGVMGGVEADGGQIGVGEPSEIMLAPHIQVEGALATIRDCVYMDPIPWVRLRHSDSTAGTAVITAEAQLTVEGWRISQFGPEVLVQQLAEGPCRAGDS